MSAEQKSGSTFQNSVLQLDSRAKVISGPDLNAGAEWQQKVKLDN